MDGLTAIAKSNEKTNEYLSGDSFISKTLERILKVLEDSSKQNTLNESSSLGETAEEAMAKNKKINSSLKTAAKNVADIKSDVSDRIGAVVICATLNKGFKDVVDALKLQIKSMPSIKDRKSGKKSTPAARLRIPELHMPKSFEKAVLTLKSIPSMVAKPFKGIASIITAPFKSIKGFFTQTFDNIKGFFSSIPKLFGNLFGGVKNFFGKLLSKKSDKQGGKGDILSVAIIAGDAVAAGQYIKTFSQITKQISKLKPLDIKKLEKSGTNIKRWAESFNKDILALKLDTDAIESFSNKIKTTVRTLNSINFDIIKAAPLTAIVNAMYGKDKDYFKGIAHYAASLGKIADNKGIDAQKTQTIASAIKSTAGSLMPAMASMLVIRPLSFVIDKLYSNSKKNYFKGIVNWLKSVEKMGNVISKIDASGISKSVGAVNSIAKSIGEIQKTIAKNISAGIILALKVNMMTFAGIRIWLWKVKLALSGLSTKTITAMQIKTKAVADIAKSLKQISVDILLSYIPMKILNKLFPNAKSDIFNGIANWAEALDKNLIQNRSFPNAAKSMKVAASMKACAAVAKSVSTFAFAALKMSISLMLIGGVVQKLETKATKSLNSLVNITNSIGDLTDKMQRLKVGKVAQATATTLLLIPYFTALSVALIPMALATVLAVGINKLSPDRAFKALTKSLSTMLTGLSNLKKELGWGILTLGLLVVFSALLLTAATLLTLALPLMLTASLGLVAAGVMFLALLLVSKIAGKCLLGALAIIACSLALVVIGVGLFFAVKALVKATELVVANFKTLLMGLGELVLVLGALALAGAASVLAAATLPAMLICAGLLIPVSIALNAAITKLNEIPIAAGLAAKVLGLAPVFLALVPVSAAAAAGAVAALAMKVSLFVIGDTMVNAFKTVQDASDAAKTIDMKALDSGVASIQNLTNNMKSFDFSILKKKFKEIDKGLSAAPSVKDAKKFADSIGVLGTVDLGLVSNFTSSFNAQFNSLVDSKNVIDSLSASIHSLSAELKNISKQKDAIKILKDIKSNSGSASGFVSDIKAKLAGTSKGPSQAQSSGKTVDDLYDLLSQINNKIEEKRAPSWNS